MKKTLAIAALALSPAIATAGPYAEAGISYLDQSSAAPEVFLDSPLGYVEVGYETPEIVFGTSIQVYVRHISGLFDRESGYGMNMIGASVRWELGD